MHNRKMWALSLVLVLVLVSLSACGAGEATANACEPEISTELALEAQNAGMAGLAAGSVTWNESHLSSFLHYHLNNLDRNSKDPVQKHL